MTQALSVQEGGGEVVPISPTDAKAWELVTTVLDWMSENGSYNYAEAFRQTGVKPYNYYRAIKLPFVQGRIVERLDALDKAVAKMLEDHWAGVVANMVRIAQGPGREAVQAARFLSQEKDRIQQQAEGQGQEEGESEASRLLKRWLGTSKTVTARQSVVTREIEVTPERRIGGVVIAG
jgi:hypothetical protein